MGVWSKGCCRFGFWCFSFLTIRTILVGGDECDDLRLEGDVVICEQCIRGDLDSRFANDALMNVVNGFACAMYSLPRICSSLSPHLNVLYQILDIHSFPRYFVNGLKQWIILGFAFGFQEVVNVLSRVDSL